MRERTGSIDIQRNGKLRVRATVKGERRSLGTYRTEDEANHRRAATLVVVSEDYGDDSRTVGQWIDTWLGERELSKHIADTETDRSRFRNHIEKDEIASIPLAKLKRADALAWVERLRGKLARQTALNTLQILRGALQAAFDREYVRANVALGIKIRRERRTVEPWTVLTPQEADRFLAELPECHRHIIAFAIGTGLRAGELVSLRSADVHLDGDSPRLVVRYGGAPSKPTKGGKIREVPLFGVGLAAAIAWRDGRKKWCKSSGTLGLFFPAPLGGFRSKEHVIRWADWRAALKSAGITRPFRQHDLRHTCASALISGEWGRSWSLREVQARLGHSSITTTERYAHFAGTALTRAGDEARATLKKENSIGRQLAADSDSCAAVQSTSTAENPSGAPETT